MPQIRNPSLQQNLSPDFVTDDRFNINGARIWSTLYGTHREGGGRLRFAWQADGPSLWTSGAGVATLTETSIADANYATTTNGGPYVALDGANDYLYIADAAWQEPTSNTFLVWQWVYFNALASSQCVISKYDANNQRSWLIQYLLGSTAMQFYVSPAAGGAGSANVLSTHAISATTWYFVAGYFQPSTLLRIFVGEGTDTALTIDSTVAGVPASAFDGTADLMFGGTWNVSPAVAVLLGGRLSIGHLRCNVPATNINGHVSRLFHETRALYM